jgi:hypothetical protein
MEKNLSEINRVEWIVWKWEETTNMGDEDRRFNADYKRTPDEARQAAEDWDSTAEERETVV